MQAATTFGPIEIWLSMGAVGHLVLAFLFLMSAYAGGVVIDRWLLFRRAHRESVDFARAARRPLAEGRLDEVVSLADRHPRSHLARVYAATLRDAAPWLEAAGAAEGFENAIRHAAEREGARVTQDFKRGLTALASIGATAPFVGLFGTVVGIMNSFFGMAAAGAGGIGAVSGGIAEALVNTAAGILVALPAVWAFNHFLGRLERVQSEMGNAGSELVDYFARRSWSDSWRLEATAVRAVRS